MVLAAWLRALYCFKKAAPCSHADTAYVLTGAFGIVRSKVRLLRRACALDARGLVSWKQCLPLSGAESPSHRTA